MLAYIAEIQKKFITEFGLAGRPDAPDIPMHVPNGIYPMIIDGKLDHVRIVDGRIYCCCFDE